MRHRFQSDFPRLWLREKQLRCAGFKVISLFVQPRQSVRTSIVPPRSDCTTYFGAEGLRGLCVSPKTPIGEDRYLNEPSAKTSVGAGRYLNEPSAKAYWKPSRRSHAPRVKSGTSTGAQPFSMDIAPSSDTQHHSARSYTSISSGSPLCRQ